MPIRVGRLALAAANERSVGELARGLALPGPAVSQHLSILKTTGLVVGQRRGRRVFYRMAAGVAVEDGRLVIRLPHGEVRMNLVALPATTAELVRPRRLLG